jgi:branched-chain amino acid transport system substrate-binding protein
MTNHKELVGRVLAATAMLAALGGGGALAQTVKIGIILTYSGPDSQPSEEIDKAIRLYVKQHDKDLPPGVKIEFIRRDDQGNNPEVAKRLGQELITRDHVQMLTGIFWSPNAFALAQVATEAKMPVVIMNAATSSITRASPYFVRFSWTIWQKSYPLGTWAAQHGAKTGYTVVSDYAPGHDAQAAFTRSFTDAGGKIVGAVAVPVVNPDVTPFLQRVKDTGPDVVFNFNPGGTQAVEFMKSWRDVGLAGSKVKLVATDDLVTDDELPSMGDEAIGVISDGPYTLTNTRPANVAFLAAWHRAYGAKDVPIYASVAAWDATGAIFDLVKETKGKFTGDQAMAILSHYKNPDSPRGPIAIDPATRDMVQNIYIRRTERVKGKLENVEIATIPQVKDQWKELNPVKAK